MIWGGSSWALFSQSLIGGKSLDLSDCYPLSLYECIRGRLPQLESLIISYLDRTVLNVFNDCPRLTRVSLSGAHSSIDLPVAQLTDLSLDEYATCWNYDDVGAYLRLIEECRALRTLYISCESDTSQEDASSPISLITHPTICKIDIFCMGFIDKLTLPRLQEVALPYSSLHALELLLHRSNCARTITNLNLFGISESRGSNGSHLLREVLSQTVNLRTLRLCLESFLSDGRSNLWAIAQTTEVVEALYKTAFLPRRSSFFA